MTLAEIMAGLGASQAVGGARTGALLTQTAEGERRQLLDAQRRLEEQQKDRGRKAKRREKRRGVGRLLGSTIGFLIGGPAGAAIGSGLGQAGAAATQRGGYKLGDVSSGLGEGMFFKGGRADISSAERDTNRYLDEANQGFLTNIAASAASDFLTFSSLGKLGGAEKYGAIAAGEGGRGEALKQMFRDNIFDFSKKGMNTLPDYMNMNQFAENQRSGALLKGSQALDKFIDPEAYKFRDSSNFIDMISQGRFG